MFLTAKFLFPIGSKFHFLLNLQCYQSLYLENLIENLSQLNYKVNKFIFQWTRNKIQFHKYGLNFGKSKMGRPGKVDGLRFNWNY